MLVKLSNLNSNFTLSLGYLIPALNNSAQKFAGFFLLLLASSFLSVFTKSFVVVVRFFFLWGGEGAYLLSSYFLSLVHLC